MKIFINIFIYFFDYFLIFYFQLFEKCDQNFFWVPGNFLVRVWVRTGKFWISNSKNWGSYFKTENCFWERNFRFSECPFSWDSEKILKFEIAENFSYFRVSLVQSRVRWFTSFGFTSSLVHECQLSQEWSFQSCSDQSFVFLRNFNQNAEYSSRLGTKNNIFVVQKILTIDFCTNLYKF
jgi:hypothetical protein